MSTSSNLSPVKQALLALEQLRARVAELERERNEPVAIVGMACRVPGAADPAAFWEILRNARDAVSDVPKSRWDNDALYHPDPSMPGRIATRRAGFLDCIDEFEPEFFGISPREALAMDPQQRLLLEVAWEALESAGLAPASLAGSKTGVFVGITGDEFAQRFHKAGDASRFDIYYASGVARSVAAGRIAYVLGLHGPNLSIDTACSSSLVAVHTACLHLRAGECRLALAGGANVLLSPEITAAFSRSRMLAPDGRCKAFDAAADGFVRGEGCGLVVLKRLSDALADGDNVLAVIRGSAVNQDGRSSGLTVPNGPAQEDVIRAALANAGVAPAALDYIEAHGTGTSLGDPIEAHALAAALGEGRRSPLAVGSVKTNIGHLESAAGVAGLIKVVLSLQAEHIPAHLHFTRMNPHIDWQGMPVEIPVSGRDWKRGAKPRLAGVSSFGFSGTNAHVIVEEAPLPAPREAEAPPRGLHVLALSARTDTALAALTGRYRALAGNWTDICYTANTGRTHFAERAVYIGANAEELWTEPVAQGRAQGGARVAFLFSGQGAQYAGMGRELYDTEPVFRRAMDRCAALAPGLLETIYGSKTADLEQTRYTQPALFAVEYALAELWRSWGVEPAAVLGHSVGEYAALCVAGYLAPEEGMRLIVARGRLMGDLPAGEGTMAAILAPEAEVCQRLTAGVSIAAVNGPENVVISGPAAEVERIAGEFAAAGVRVEQLRVSHAFHSALMEPIEEEFGRLAAAAAWSAPRLPVISSVTGEAAKPDELRQAGYWRRQVRGTVRFREAMTALAGKGCDVYVEIGPGSTLLGMGKACVEDTGQLWKPSIRRAKPDNRQIAETLAALYVRGVEVNWAGHEGSRGQRRVPLPAYPFERQRYWIDDLERTPARPAAETTAHPLLGSRVAVSLDTHPWIAGHDVHGRAILPMTAYLELMSAALDGDPVENVVITEPLVVPPGKAIELQTAVREETVEIRAREKSGDWKLYVTGNRSAQTAPAQQAGIAALRARLTSPLDIPSFYGDLATRGHNFGPSFRLVSELFTGAGEALASIEPGSEGAGYSIHPAVLDACVQTVAGAITESGSYLPVGIGRFSIARPAGGERLWAHATVEGSGDVLIARIEAYTAAGDSVALFERVELRRAHPQALSRLDGGASVFFAPAWEPASAPLRLAAIAKDVRAEAAQVSSRHGMDEYAAFRALSDRLSARAIAEALALTPGMRFHADALGVVPSQHRLLERLLGILAEDCFVRRDGDTWECLATPPPAEGGWDRYPAFGAEAAIASRSAAGLRAVLRGDADPLEVLFPGGATDSAERLYSESPGARTFNELLSRAVRAASESSTGSKFRVLEIGGGTGGTSTFVLPQFDGARTEYTFTDISPLFLARAERRFAAFPFVSYRPLDIERDPAAQGFTPGGYDLVIAANVLHATRDLRQTLEHARGLLAPGGTLVLLEVTRAERWIDISFGMTEGWWRFSDRDLRPSYPLLPPDRWRTLLAETGFEDVQSIEVGADSLNAVLLARRSARLGGNWLAAGELAPQVAAALRRAGARVTDSAPFDGIVYAPAAPEPDTDMPAAQRALCEPLLDLLHGIDASRPVRLVIVTTGAQGPDGIVNPAQAPLCGLARTITLEWPQVRAVSVDLDPANPSFDAVAEAAAAEDGETAVAWRDGRRYAARVRPAQPPPGPARFRLAVESRGTLDNLQILPAERRAPGPGQIEIAVEIAALGFRDVMNVLGLYPGDPGPLGAECVGRVSVTGSGVTEFAPGDRVLAVAPGCHDGYVVADAALAAPLPATLSPEDAITLPVPYLTAIYALEHLGRIRAGDRVLIHAAAGGVGLAAVHVAQRAGAEVFATAGTAEKRQFLRSLGIAHAMNSRSTAFAAEVSKATGGRGVDLVLNSLAGDAIAASLTCLAPGGRFLELGKTGLLDPKQVAALGSDIAYFAIDWSEELPHNKALIGGMLRRIVAEAPPPLPRTIFPFRDAALAYRHMAQARHTGRVLLRQDSEVAIRPDRSYLITGGLTGLGLLAARHLAGRGARSLVLVGRRAPSEAALRDIADMESRGVRVVTATLDVADRAALRTLVGRIDPPLAGVIHSAGALNDALLADQDWSRFDSVFRAKVYGAWNLHELTAELPLDFFVLFSSIASVLGAPGQVNHAAANAFEDALAAYRRSRGLTAMSINWGAWTGTGSADRPEFEQRRRKLGLASFTAREGIGLFGRLLEWNPPQMAAARIDWQRYAESFPLPKGLLAIEKPAAAERPPETRKAVRGTATLAGELASAPEGKRARIVESHVQSLAARILGLPAGRRIDPRQPLHELGLDSLMAIEFRNGLSAACGRPLPATLLFSYPAIDDLTGYVLAEFFPAAPTVAAAAATVSSRLLGAVSELSDEEVDRRLAARLGGKE